MPLEDLVVAIVDDGSPEMVAAFLGVNTEEFTNGSSLLSSLLLMMVPPSSWV